MKVNKDFALLYGIMLGDGCLSLINKKRKFLVISSCFYDDMDFVKSIISPLLEKLIGNRVNFKLRPKNGVIEFNFINSILFDFISSFGFPIGKKGIELEIPSVFYKKRLLKYVVKGYFATDGSLVFTKNPNLLYPRLEASSISKKLMEQICKFFNDNGIKCNLYLRKSKNWKWNQQYRIQSNGKVNLRLFNQKIGFLNPKHYRKFEGFMAALGVEPRTPSS